MCVAISTGQITFTWGLDMKILAIALAIVVAVLFVVCCYQQATIEQLVDRLGRCVAGFETAQVAGEWCASRLGECETMHNENPLIRVRMDLAAVHPGTGAGIGGE